MRNNSRLGSVAFLGILSSVATAQSVTSVLTPNDAYIATPARIANDADYQGAQLVMKALNGTPASIPRTWRLVNALPLEQSQSKNSRFILFFQDANNNIHTLAISTDGALTGDSTFHIPSK